MLPIEIRRIRNGYIVKQRDMESSFKTKLQVARYILRLLRIDFKEYK